ARPDEIEDEVIRERASVREAARLDPARGRVGRRDVRAQLGEEPALADTWLAEDRGDPALSRPHDRERVAQTLQLLVAPDHRRMDLGPQAARAHRAGAQTVDAICVDGFSLALELERTRVGRVDE